MLYNPTKHTSMCDSKISVTRPLHKGSFFMYYNNITNKSFLFMFAVFTTPIQFTKSYKKAVQIADAFYNKTGYVVAVESINNSTAYHVPSVTTLGA